LHYSWLPDKYQGVLCTGEITIGGLLLKATALQTTLTSSFHIWFQTATLSA
jgi:hypothetical protein